MIFLLRCYRILIVAVSLLPIALGCSNRKTTGGNTASDNFNQGVAALQNGNYDLAITEFSQAIIQDPESIGSYFNRGWSYSQKGEFDKAVADYTETIRIDPQDATAFVNRGLSYERKKDYNRAIADHSEAIRLNAILPNLPDFVLKEGSTEQLVGETRTLMNHGFRTEPLGNRNNKAYR